LRAADRDAGAIGSAQRRAEPSAIAHIYFRTARQGEVVPARSKKQQMAAGAALAAKRGERSKQSLKGASRQMVESMSERQLREFARTKRKGLPRKRRG